MKFSIEILSIYPTLYDVVFYASGASADLSPELRPKHIIKFDDIIPISAKNKTSTETLKDRLRELLDLYADMEYERETGQQITRKTERVREELGERMEGNPIV